MGPLASAPLLAVRDVTIRFGGIVALDGVSFDMPDQGDLLFQGESIVRATPHRVAALGIGRTFQNLALFPRMTVLQNVMVGVHARTRSDFLSNALRLPWVGREEGQIREAALELIAFLELGAVAHHPAAGLPFGTLKR